MVYNLIINSSNNVSINNNLYKYNFPNSLNIPEGSEICINNAIIPYSWFNVSSLIGNNYFYYIYPVAANSFTINATNSTTITISLSTTGTLLQVGSIIPTGLNTVNNDSNYIYITALGSGTGNNGTYIVNQAVTYSAYSTSCSKIIKKVTLNDGFYTLDSINSALYSSLYSNGIFFFNLNPNQLTSNSLGHSNENILYPFKFISYPTQYCNAIQYQYFPLLGTISTIFGVNWTYAIGNSNLPTDIAQTGQIVIPTTVTNLTYSFGNIVGFQSGTYPSAVYSYSGIPTQTNCIPPISLGNSLQYTPPFPAEGTFVNGLIIRCNLVENLVSGQSDVLECIPITSQFGSNINYFSSRDSNWIKLRKGQYKELTLSIVDQNFNPININDPNILISLLIKFPNN